MILKPNSFFVEMTKPTDMTLSYGDDTDLEWIVESQTDHLKLKRNK